MLKKFKIGNTLIGEDFPAYIIAEAGVNHNGKIELAIKLVDQAKKIGANAIKFQTFSAEKLVTANAEKAKYQLRMKDNNNRRNTDASYSDNNDEVTQQLEALDAENSSKN